MEEQKIAIYLPTLCGGGAERVMVTLANGFADKGLSVDLVLAQAKGPYLADVSTSVRLIDLNSSRVLASLPGLVRYLRRTRPTVMLSAMSHANVIAATARCLSHTSTQLVVTEHSLYSVANAAAKYIRNRIMRFLVRWTYSRADGIVAVSTGVAEDLSSAINLPLEQIQTIYNPVLTDALLESSRQFVDHPWFGPDKPPVILGVGRLTAAKNFSLLIEAFAQVRCQRKAHLLILGEGELRSELESLVLRLGLKHDVILPGFVSNPYMYMRNSAMFVLSSSWEGFSLVLVEAMACGTRVVSTDCPSGPAEILENGKWGRLVPSGNVDALAHAMAETLEDSDPPDAAKRAVCFSMNKAIDEYLNILH